MGITAHADKFAPPAPQQDGKFMLVGMSRDEMAAALQASGFEAYRARQLWHWVYHQGVTSFDAMTSLAKTARAQLAEQFIINRPTIARAQESSDGTRKWLLKMPDNQLIEAVHIPETDRGALCVSSQVGCTLTCRFCHTGTQPLVRNLSASEIVAQIMHCRDALEEWPSGSARSQFTNIVMMGMGEPLYNYDNVAKALKIVMDGDGIAISKRRITLSTSGVVPMIERCGAELGVNLAISLHAVSDDLRDEIMPINKKYPLKDLLQACRNYPGLSNARRITFEYVMLKGINDSPADARALAKLLRGIPSKINLIPFNPWPGSNYECSDAATIRRFGDILAELGYACPVRTPRGQDILAACGQLRSDSQRQRNSAAQ